MSRWKAAGIHLSISILIGLVVGALLFGVWYPPPFFHAAGADMLVLLLVGVDVVLGPLLTLIVFKSGKRGLKFDLALHRDHAGRRARLRDVVVLRVAARCSSSRPSIASCSFPRTISIRSDLARGQRSPSSARCRGQGRVLSASLLPEPARNARRCCSRASAAARTSTSFPSTTSTTRQARRDFCRKRKPGCALEAQMRNRGAARRGDPQAPASRRNSIVWVPWSRARRISSCCSIARPANRCAPSRSIRGQVDACADFAQRSNRATDVTPDLSGTDKLEARHCDTCLIPRGAKCRSVLKTYRRSASAWMLLNSTRASDPPGRRSCSKAGPPGLVRCSGAIQFNFR